MNEIKIKQTGLRLDKILSNELDLSRSQIQRLITEGQITLNGELTKANIKPKIDDLIEIKQIDRPPLKAEPEDIPLDIIYEDDDVLVVNKPAGMVVHPASGHYHGTLVNGLMYHTKLAKSTNDFRPGIVHRIDKDTSGLLMVAKSELALKSLSDQLKNKQNLRKYQALVTGRIEEDEGTIEAPLGRDPKNRLKRAVISGGKDAITHFSVKKRFDNFTLIDCQLETGRTHQIRVHLNYIGHPLVGDPLYGVTGTTKIHQGQLLHAGTLGFSHPLTKEFLTFSVPLPADFQNILKTME
ncbi:RluA family pseudouridine synthase [Xylocopilactobacillus apicola]|uniref:Pseudouridine synthase n=1 Tax=Xylocopilactobacillus apicola TaxID=2932184 RepID=A0AAU9DFA3_9LACO|nr:RluA family pseudouridine synthase [Xylocopilactobacillus apicola]BDR58605.1 pseudouridine synthase [Xylocopilactobacillus apicola]